MWEVDQRQRQSLHTVVAERLRLSHQIKACFSLLSDRSSTRTSCKIAGADARARSDEVSWLLMPTDLEFEHGEGGWGIHASKMQVAQLGVKIGLGTPSFYAGIGRSYLAAFIDASHTGPESHFHVFYPSFNFPKGNILMNHGILKLLDRTMYGLGSKSRGLWLLLRPLGERSHGGFHDGPNCYHWLGAPSTMYALALNRSRGTNRDCRAIR